MVANSKLQIFKEKYASDIRFWILLFFVIRLFGITNPPLEIAHNWRQVTGDMVARNFYEVDSNILYPRLDSAGEKTGITGTEFSVLNYLMYLLSLIFGFHDWFGRLINLIVSSYGIFYFYKLLKLKFDEKFAFYSAFILLTSMWLMFSRKTMPDTFSTSLVIIALYHAFSYLNNLKFPSLILYFVFVTLGVLSKIPAIYLVAVLCFPIFDKTILMKDKVWLIAASLLMVIPVAIWYFYWVPYLISEYGYSNYYMGTDMANGFFQITSNLSLTLEKFYFDALKFSGFAICLIGFVFAILKKEKTILWLTAICSFAFAVFMLKAGRNFYHHSYYIVPFVPVMSLFVAYGLLQFKKKGIQVFLLLAITTESIANQQHDFVIKQSEVYKLSLEGIASKVCKPTDLIAINGDQNPQLLYFTHRKGWSIANDKVEEVGFMKSIIGLGSKFLFLDKHSDSSHNMSSHINWSLVFENEHFVVYSLRN